MPRLLSILMFAGLIALPLKPVFAQTHQDYAPPFVHTGNGFWYQNALDNYQYNYETYDQFRRHGYDEPQRYYRAHRNVFVSISDDRDPVRPGEPLTYFITVDNPINTTASVDITAFIDPNTDFREASNNGQRTGDRVRWNDVVIYGGTKRVLSVTVRVNTDVYHAEKLSFRAMADQVSATEVTSVEDTRQAPIAPPTIAPPHAYRDGGVEYIAVRGDAYPQHTTSRVAETSERFPDRDFQVTLRTAGEGADVVYTLTVENHTNRTLKDVDVTHAFQTGVDRVEILSAAGGADKGDRITWFLGYLQPYEYRVFTYRVRFRGTDAVRSAVNAISRDPALRATTGDTVRVGMRQGVPYVYNYDAVRYPQSGVADFFFKKRSDAASPFLSPVHRRSDITIAVVITIMLMIAGASAYVIQRRAWLPG